MHPSPWAGQGPALGVSVPASSLSSASYLLCSLHKSFPSLGLLQAFRKLSLDYSLSLGPCGPSQQAHEHKSSHCGKGPSLPLTEFTLHRCPRARQELHLCCGVSSPHSSSYRQGNRLRGGPRQSRPHREWASGQNEEPQSPWPCISSRAGGHLAQRRPWQACPLAQQTWGGRFQGGVPSLAALGWGPGLLLCPSHGSAFSQVRLAACILVPLLCALLRQRASQGAFWSTSLRSGGPFLPGVKE